MFSKKLTSVFMMLVMLSVIGTTFFFNPVNSATQDVNNDLVFTPKINYFTASSTSISAGDIVTLSWSTKNTYKVEIIGIESSSGTYGTTDSIEVRPDKTTTYTLNAYASNGIKASSKVVVTVSDFLQVRITSFTASAEVINYGDKITLAWTTQNAYSVKIRGDEVGTVYSGLPLNGNYVIIPEKSTAYTIEATGKDGTTVYAHVTITVIGSANVSILSFTASETTVSKGTLVTFKWNTTNADNVQFMSSTGVVTSVEKSGSVSVTPNSTRTYTLRATDINGNQVEKSITIYVV
jgi:plastocyanin